MGSAEGLYAGGTLTVTNGTTYVMIDSNGVIQTSTMEWQGEYAKLAIVTASGGIVTNIAIWKNDAVGGELTKIGFQNISDTVYTR